jgi:DNA-binding transcriptional LysR family regulator
VKDCAPIYSKYPYLRLHLQSNDPPNRIDLVRRGQADLAVIAPEDVPNEMDSKVLKPDRYLLVASHKWKGRKLHDILTEERMIDFAENDSTTMNYLKKFKLTAQRSRLFVNENEALIHLFTQGAGYGTLTESIAEPHVKAGKLIVLNRAQALEDPLALAWYPRTHKPTYFVDLIRTIK